MEGFEGLTDEEIALKLQEQFMNEEQQQQPKSQSGANEKDEDEDTRLARLLQEQFDREDRK